MLVLSGFVVTRGSWASVNWVIVLLPNGLFKPWLIVIRCDDLKLKGLD